MKNRVFTLLFILLAFSSCNEWLDIDPNTQISQEELFGTSQGFEMALNGIYTDMSDVSMYGKGLSYYYMDSWANVFVIPYNERALKYLAAFEYESTEVMRIGENIWTKAFNIIANCNNLIKNIETTSDDKFKYKSVQKNLIHGEALAARAFLHFDLFRIFGKSFKVDKNAALVPYITDYPSIVNPPLKGTEFMDKVIEDLEKALVLVAEYDTIENPSGFYSQRFATTNTADNQWGSFGMSRGFRLNFYSIQAVLSRVCLYAEKYDKCLKYSKNVITKEKNRYFKWIRSYQYGASVYSYEKYKSSELILAFHNSLIKTTFLEDWDVEKSSWYKFRVEDIDGIYEENPNDMRKNAVDANSVLRMYNNEYASNDDKYNYYVPNLRLTELYYNAAECLIDSDPTKAAEYINYVLKKRSVPNSFYIGEDATKEEFYNKIVNEYRKEFLGEGQLVFLYKRLNLPIKCSQGDIVNDGLLQLPIPDSEQGL